MIPPGLHETLDDIACTVDASAHADGGRAAVQATRLALQEHGFAVVQGLFAREELQAVEQLLDRAFDAAAQSAPARAFLVRYPADAAIRRDGWDQLELNHATALVPELLKTTVYRGCTRLARALAGPVSRAFDHVIYKNAHNATETPWHQDAAFRLWQATPPRQLHFWVPLQEVPLASGCMAFMPGSHRARRLPHHRTLRASGRSGREVPMPLDTGAIACPLPIGGLTIHTPSTLHCAGRNQGAIPRKAWILQYGPLGGLRLAMKRLTGALPPPLGLGCAGNRGSDTRRVHS